MPLARTTDTELTATLGSGGVRSQPNASIARWDGWLRRLPLLPALIYVVVVTQIPFVLTIWYSLQNWNLLNPEPPRFAGLQNYLNVITDPSIRIAIWNTIVLTVCAVALSVALGLAIAVLLNREIYGRGILRTLMIGPFLVMPTAAALMWKDTLLSPLTGLVDYVLTPIGLGRVDWINQFPMASIVGIEVWRWTPFMMLIVLAGLQSQNQEVIEAAKVDGARPWQLFRYITLPTIRPFLELGALLGSLFIVQTFDTIFMTTQGGPGTATTNLPFLLYLVAFQGFDIGKASAIGVVAVLLTIVVASLALRTLFTIFIVEARR
jgi:sorbitol/mannitol transport system permease protein